MSALHHHHNTSSHTLQTRQNCTQCSTTARDGWGWQIHSVMLFLLFEKAIRADVIKPVCITEVFWRNSDRVQTHFHSAQMSHQKHQELGYRGVMTETFAKDVNQTPTACVSLCCKNAYRKQSCIYQSSVCSHFKTVVHLSMSRSARLFKLWLDTWWMCIIFLVYVS